MRRVLAVALSVFAALAFVATDASAQAPTSKVTINGLVDNITSYTKNMSIVDVNAGRQTDTEWYARFRIRPDITGEVGTTKFVLGIEIDSTWGQTGATDATAPNRFGTSGSLDLNTDVLNQLELKWAYTEFDFPGIPFATRARIGAQPWQATYKSGVLATGDFAGVHLSSTLAPPVKLNATWAQVEEESTGPRDGFIRGEDHALVLSVEITPFKGFDIRPIYSWFRADGNTSTSSRHNRGGLANSAVFFPAGAIENRHTIGIDSRLRMGPFSLDPTVFYQFGEVERGGTDQEMRAWFFDVRGGFQTGPLLLEVAAIYTTGNKANEDIRLAGRDINYFQPISTDSGFYGTWAEHWALGIDYFNAIHNGTGMFSGTSIGYDKYGLARLGARASYAITPSFSPRIAVTGNWTAEEVDTSGTKSAALGIVPGDFRGNSRYLGTEVDLGFTWRFAPGVALDVVGAYTFAGKALDAALAVNTNTGIVRGHGEADDVKSLTARVRYNF